VERERIVSFDQWAKLTGTIIDNDKIIFDLSKGFSYFPDSLNEIIFQYSFEGPNEFLKEVTKEEFDT